MCGLGLRLRIGFKFIWVGHVSFGLAPAQGLRSDGFQIIFGLG